MKDRNGVALQRYEVVKVTKIFTGNVKIEYLGIVGQVEDEYGYVQTFPCSKDRKTCADCRYHSVIEREKFICDDDHYFLVSPEEVIFFHRPSLDQLKRSIGLILF